MSGYLRNMGDNIRMLQRGLADVEDVARYATTTPEVQDAPDARPLSRAIGEVGFEHVTFRYKSRRDADLRRLLAAHPAGRADGAGGADRLGQVDLRQAAAAALRRAGRAHPDRRPGHRRRAARRAAARHRGGAAGSGAVPPLHRREHRLRPARTRRWRRSPWPPSAPAPTTSSPRCPRATTPWSASGA